MEDQIYVLPEEWIAKLPFQAQKLVIHEAKCQVRFGVTKFGIEPSLTASHYCQTAQNLKGSIATSEYCTKTPQNW